MSHIIDILQSYPESSYYEQRPNRNHINYQNLSHYLKSYAHLAESIKYFQSRNEKCEILLEIELWKNLPTVIQKIHIDRKRSLYSSKFVFKSGGEFINCQTKCLRIMIIREVELLKKKMRSCSFCLAIDQYSGQLIGKNIFTVTPATNLYQLLLCQLVPFQAHFSRIFTILLTRVNKLPTMYNQYLHERTKSVSELSTEQKIERRIYKYYYFSIVELWKSLSLSPAALLENPQDKELFKRLQGEVWSGFGEESTEMYMHRLPSKFANPYIFDVTEEETLNIKVHLNVPKMGKRSESNFIFNEIKVLQESSQALDTGYRGATNKIKLSKLRFIYANSLTNPNQNHNNRTLAAKQYTKAVGIKMPLQNINAKCAKKKSEHEIKILKLFNDAESPFLLRYFVYNSPTFKYNNMLMMNFMSNCDTLASFLVKKKEALSFSSKIYVLINVLQALRLIKEYQVVHMDLSPGNVLVSSNYISHLIDFGQSYNEKICGNDYNPGYTLPFSFPQKFTHKHFTTKSDIFSFGVLAFHCIFKTMPYQSSSQLVQSLKNFTYLKKFYFAPEAADYSGYSKLIIFLLSFIQKCMDPDPEMRPHPSWSIIMFKELYYWMFEVSMMV